MITLKSPQEIECIRKCCQIAVKTLEYLARIVEPGKTTGELNEVAEKFIQEWGAVPAFKGYRGFPKSICTSINEEVVHGIPSFSRKLNPGDIVSIDVGIYKLGYYGDLAVTIPVGEIALSTKKLLQVTQEALRRGIDRARVGYRLFDISHAVQSYVEKEGFSVVRDFVGHGIGKEMHEDPQVPNFGEPGKGLRLKAGMVLAIEPMVNAGGPEVMVLPDHWTVVTQDGSISAHFEHTVAITEEGPQILTLSPDSRFWG